MGATPDGLLSATLLDTSASVLPAAAGLHLFVACGPFAVALDADHVERLLLPDEPCLVDSDPVPWPPARLGLLEAGGEPRTAWDLGLLLGLPAQDAAWVLLRGNGAASGSALRTGPCLSVGPLPASGMVPLPAALCRSRPGVFRAAFAARPHGRRLLGPVGLVLDLGRLWSDEEKAYAASLLEVQRA
jgi:hypothetical protein